jgi:phosphoglycolate phosphatase
MTDRFREEEPVAERNVTYLGQGLDEALTQNRRRGEADSWWWVVSLVLMAIGLYLLLAVHLLADVIHASALVWAAGFAGPVALFIGAGLALGKEAGFSIREQVSAVPAVLLGSAPLGSPPEEPSTKRAVILFDIDGTLISTGGAGAAAWCRAFEDLYDIPVDIRRFTDVGMTDPEVGRLTFQNVLGRDPTPDEMAAIMSRRLAHLPRAVAESEGYQVLDGVRELLERLSQDGFLLGLTTGGVEAAAHIKLARAGLNHYFCFGGYGSDSSDRAELTRTAIERAGLILGGRLDPDRVLVVGDTPLDIEAAHAAAAISIGVASGHYDAESLRAAGADFVLGSLREELPGVAKAAA